MCLFFSGAVLGCHVYLITDGSIVTSSMTSYKYRCYVIITRRPYLSVVGSPMLPFSANLLDSSECKTLQNRNGKFMFRNFLCKMECSYFVIYYLNNFLAMKNRTHQTGK